MADQRTTISLVISYRIQSHKRQPERAGARGIVSYERCDRTRRSCHRQVTGYYNKILLGLQVQVLFNCKWWCEYERSRNFECKERILKFSPTRT